MTALATIRGRFAGDQPSEAFDRRLLAPMIAGALLNPVNSSIIAVSLVPIGVAFGAAPSATAWLVSALYLATAVGQPVVGRLIDVLGPRRLFLPATALVGVAGVVGTIAPSLGWLIVARVLLGFGTCAGYPAAMRLIRSEADRTGHDSPAGVLTILSISTQTIAVIGPPLGGLLIGLGGWRTTLAVNIPLSLAALFVGWRRLPREPWPEPQNGAGGLGLDYAGMVLFAAMLVSLLLFVSHLTVSNGYLLLIAVGSATAFYVRELRVRDPFIDLRTLAGNGPLLLTYIRSLFAYVVAYAFLYGYTQWLEDGRGLSASQAGLIQLPVFATGLAVAAVTGRRKELRGKLIGGAAGQIIACLLMFTLQPDSDIGLLIVIALVFGIPQGLNGLALQNSVYRQTDPERVGSSAGLLRTFGYLGAITASTLQGAIYGKTADTSGLHHLAVILLAAGAVFLLLTVFDRSLGRIADPGRPAPRAT